MVTLEQIKLLESKISRAVNFVAKLTEENARLKKRNDELEETITLLQEEKTRVEEGIVSALGKLNQFEDAIERSLSSVKSNPKPAPKEPVQKEPVQSEMVQKEPVQNTETVIQKQNSVPSVYEIDEEPAEVEDTGEAELDIF